IIVSGEFALRLLQRSAIVGRQDDDRRKDERLAPERSDLASEPRRLPRRARYQDAGAVQLAAAVHAARIFAAPRAIRSEPSACPSACAAAGVVANAKRSPRNTWRPSRLAIKPRNQSSSPRIVAYAASGVWQSPARLLPNARSAGVASVVRSSAGAA